MKLQSQHKNTGSSEDCSIHSPQVPDFVVPVEDKHSPDSMSVLRIAADTIQHDFSSPSHKVPITENVDFPMCVYLRELNTVLMHFEVLASLLSSSEFVRPLLDYDDIGKFVSCHALSVVFDLASTKLIVPNNTNLVPSVYQETSSGDGDMLPLVFRVNVGVLRTMNMEPKILVSLLDISHFMKAADMLNYDVIANILNGYDLRGAFHSVSEIHMIKDDSLSKHECAWKPWHLVGWFEKFGDNADMTYIESGKVSWSDVASCVDKLSFDYSFLSLAFSPSLMKLTYMSTKETMPYVKVANLQTTFGVWKVRMKNILLDSTGHWDNTLHIKSLSLLTGTLQRQLVDVHGRDNATTILVLYSWHSSFLTANYTSILDQASNCLPGLHNCGLILVLLTHNSSDSDAVHCADIITFTNAIHALLYFDKIMEYFMTLLVVGSGTLVHSVILLTTYHLTIQEHPSSQRNSLLFDNDLQGNVTVSVGDSRVHLTRIHLCSPMFTVGNNLEHHFLVVIPATAPRYFLPYLMALALECSIIILSGCLAYVFEIGLDKLSLTSNMTYLAFETLFFSFITYCGLCKITAIVCATVLSFSTSYDVGFYPQATCSIIEFELLFPKIIVMLISHDLIRELLPKQLSTSTTHNVIQVVLTLHYCSILFLHTWSSLKHMEVMLYGIPASFIAWSGLCIAWSSLVLDIFWQLCVDGARQQRFEVSKSVTYAVNVDLMCRARVDKYYGSTEVDHIVLLLNNFDTSQMSDVRSTEGFMQMAIEQGVLPCTFSFGGMQVMQNLAVLKDHLIYSVGVLYINAATALVLCLARGYYSCGSFSHCSSTDCYNHRSFVHISTWSQCKS